MHRALRAAGVHSAEARDRGRSRNDQVATDLRLWLRDELQEIEGYLVILLQVVAERAEKDIEYVMPGYTHLQRAQVSRQHLNKMDFVHQLIAHSLESLVTQLRSGLPCRPRTSTRGDEARQQMPTWLWRSLRECLFY